MKGDEMKPGLEAEYAQGRARKDAELLVSSTASLGQTCPTQCPGHCPQHCPRPDEVEFVSFSEQLGEPLSIREAAALIGVSAWTVRHCYVPNGLPHFRTQRRGKLIFYKQQVIDWLLSEQRKGGLFL